MYGELAGKGRKPTTCCTGQNPADFAREHCPLGY